MQGWRLVMSQDWVMLEPFVFYWKERLPEDVFARCWKAIGIDDYTNLEPHRMAEFTGNCQRAFRDLYGHEAKP
jgi:hypothetical protein